MLGLKWLNAELDKQNQAKDQELEHLRKSLKESGADVVAALREEIVGFKELVKDVGYLYVLFCIFVPGFCARGGGGHGVLVYEIRQKSLKFIHN